MSAQVAARRWLLAARLMAVAAIWSLALVIVAVWVPIYGASTSSQDTGISLTRQTLLQQKGIVAVLLVAVPLAACVVVIWSMVRRRRDDPWWATRAAWTAIGALTVVALVGILTIGAWMLPVAALLAAGVRLAPPWADVRAPAPDAPATTGSGTGPRADDAPPPGLAAGA